MAGQEPTTVFTGEITQLIINEMNYNFAVKSAFTDGDAVCTDTPNSVINWTLLPTVE